MPYTSGILIGIGETREERIDSLLALQGLHREYGHLQACRLIKASSYAMRPPALIH